MKFLKKLLCFILTAALLSSDLTIPVFAEETDEAVLFKEVGISLAADTAPELTVTFPKDIKCNTPVDFTLNLSNQASGYKYMLYSFDIVYSDGSSEMLVDISRNNPYQDNNTYTYTFYASGTYRIRFSAFNKTTLDSVRSQTYVFTVDDPDYPSVEEKADAVAAECNGKCSTDYEKALWLHDWILDHITYDNSLTYCSAEGALARGIGTCESYHRAYVMLLNRVGIPSGRVTGNGHVWTAVKMDGEWYQVDPTWNDTSTNRHLYFGLNDYLTGLAHPDHAAASASPDYQYTSTSLENNYLIQSGEIKKWSALFENSITEKLVAGETTFSIPIPDTEYQTYDTEIIYHLVAYYLSMQKWNGRTINASYSSIKEESSGNQVSYKDRKITVQTSTAESLRITPPTKTNYTFGDKIDLSGLTVTLMYTDGSSDTLQPDQYQVSGFSTDVVGNRKATVSYGAFSTTFDYSVADAVSYLSVTPPTKLSYTLGENVSRDGLKVTAFYLSGKTAEIAYGQYELSDFSAKTAIGTLTATVSYGGKSATFSYTVQENIKPAQVSYRTHVQTFGWQEFVRDGAMSGTCGQAKRLEGIEIKLSTQANLGIQYTTHCQSYGWLPWSSNGEMSGTSGESKRMEAIKIQLTGADKEKYDVYYRVHVESYGWLGWAKNGEAAGTTGYSKRLEGIQIVLVTKGASFNQNMDNIVSASDNRFMAKTGGEPFVAGASSPNTVYRTHIQTYGWQERKSNGAISGTVGEAKRLEGIELSLSNMPYSGGIVYRTHVQTYGWQDWKSNGAMSGTVGEAKRLEAIEIKLNGDIEKYYDVYYRVHVQQFGWMGWAKNGAPSGTAGYGLRMEGIQIKLVPKGEAAPGSTSNIFRQK